MSLPALSARQQKLLSAIITEYVDSAKPVSSGHLVARDGLDISAATVRNDMVALEEAGYLMQPHTSAGRIPTEAAWKWFVGNVLTEKTLRQKEQTHLADVIHAYRHTQSELMRRLAKTIAELAEEAVVVSFDKNDNYYTGLSNLFAQPEFEQVNLLQNLSRVVDQMDDVMQRMFDQVDREVQVLVGKDNPFSSDFGTVVARYEISGGPSGLIGILGPMRQDYDEHLALIKHAQHLLRNL